MTLPKPLPSESPRLVLEAAGLKEREEGLAELRQTPSIAVSKINDCFCFKPPLLGGFSHSSADTTERSTAEQSKLSP